MTEESLEDEVETSWEKITASAGASIASTAHSALCPVHGIIPGAAKAAGTTAALTEYELLKPFMYIHEVQMQYTSAALGELDGRKHHYKKETTTHSGHTHDNLHPYTEPVVSGSNLFMMALSVGYLTNSLYKVLGEKDD